MIKKFLFFGLFSLVLGLGEAAHALGVVSMIGSTKAKQLRETIYSGAIKQMRSVLEQGENKAGYHWEIPMVVDRDLHISHMTFDPGNYGPSHTRALSHIILSCNNLIPLNGYILRPELWTHKKNANGSVEHIHWVHPEDMTQTEKGANPSQYFDPAVRSLDGLAQAGPVDSAHIVLRFGTKGKLSQGVGQVVTKLQAGQSKNSTYAELEKNRQKFGKNLIAHVSIARIFRCKGKKKGDQQGIYKAHLRKLQSAFNLFRGSVMAKASTPNPRNKNKRVIQLKINSIQITEGVRNNRIILKNFT